MCSYIKKAKRLCTYIFHTKSHLKIRNIKFLHLFIVFYSNPSPFYEMQFLFPDQKFKNKGHEKVQEFKLKCYCWSLKMKV